jgi:hypothetical protein
MNRFSQLFGISLSGAVTLETYKLLFDTNGYFPSQKSHNDPFYRFLC